MAKKFIIITTARSGSQMLCEFLDKQLNIRCELELLQHHQEVKYRKLQQVKNSNSKTRKYYDRCVEILGTDYNKFVGNRNRNFVEYLKIWEELKSSKYFGHKLFFDHHLGEKKLPAVDAISYSDFLKYVKDNEIKIIHLTRDNILLKYISTITSRISGVYNSSGTSLINSGSVTVLYEDFIHYKEELLQEQQDVYNFCSENSIDCHHVTYENLIGENYVSFYKDILSFIGEDPELFIDIRDTPQQAKTKTNIYHITHKVSNLENLIKKATDANDTELLENINIQLAKKV